MKPSITNSENYYLCVKYLFPLIRDKEFYIRLRDNFAVIEIWNYPAPKPTIEELNEAWPDADIYFRLEEIKKETIKRLIASDWTHLTDNPLSPEKQEEWRFYRRKLRVFPEVCDPYNPNWPKEPSNNEAKEEKKESKKTKKSGKENE